MRAQDGALRGDLRPRAQQLHYGQCPDVFGKRRAHSVVRSGIVRWVVNRWVLDTWVNGR